ncbi:MAG: hypothetical protein JRS35_02600 [Deltaproteobacteria bacterium]|nr:hypothetical protein [Deltaproteobacteria bacterium]
MTVVPDDEYLHPAPADIEGLWSDNLWFSICDREADVFGVNHIHATNKGYARYSTMLVIDGLPMPWANKAPLTATGKFDELGVAIHHDDELRWFSERVIARLGSATT